MPANKQKKDFKEMLKKKDHENVFVSFVVCSNNKKDVKHLDKLDKKIAGVDVTDDYDEELAQIRKKQGWFVPFSKGDHLTKMLVGPISHFDGSDECKREF